MLRKLLQIHNFLIGFNNDIVMIFFLSLEFQSGLFYGLGVRPGKRYDSYSESLGTNWTMRIAKRRIEEK